MPTCLGADFLSPVMIIVFHPPGMEVGRRILQKEKLCPALGQWGRRTVLSVVYCLLTAFSPKQVAYFGVAYSDSLNPHFLPTYIEKVFLIFNQVYGSFLQKKRVHHR